MKKKLITLLSLISVQINGILNGVMSLTPQTIQVITQTSLELLTIVIAASLIVSAGEILLRHALQLVKISRQQQKEKRTNDTKTHPQTQKEQQQKEQPQVKTQPQKQEQKEQSNVGKMIEEIIAGK